MYTSEKKSHNHFSITRFLFLFTAQWRLFQWECGEWRVSLSSLRGLTRRGVGGQHLGWPPGGRHHDWTWKPGSLWTRHGCESVWHCLEWDRKRLAHAQCHVEGQNIHGHFARLSHSTGRAQMGTTRVSKFNSNDTTYFFRKLFLPTYSIWLHHIRGISILGDGDTSNHNVHIAFSVKTSIFREKFPSTFWRLFVKHAWLLILNYKYASKYRTNRQIIAFSKIQTTYFIIIRHF